MRGIRKLPRRMLKVLLAGELVAGTISVPAFGVEDFVNVGTMEEKRKI